MSRLWPTESEGCKEAGRRLSEGEEGSKVGKILMLIAGGSSLLAGIAVIIGWWGDIAVLKSILPQWVTMKPNTALCFALLGTSLLLTIRSSPPWAYLTARFCTLLAGLIALLTLGEYLFSWNPGFDQWLFAEPPGTVGTSHPGRMAPFTAVCFLLLAAGIESGRDRKRVAKQYVAVFLALLVAIIALIDLFTHLARAFDAFGLWGLTVMAVHTALLFALQGVAIAIYSWPINISISSPAGKTVSSIAIWTLILAGSLVWSIQQLGEAAQEEAVSIARVNINKDISLRKWASSHGGVYVKPTEQTPPNPYLNVPDRDLVTTDGVRLTMMNPAYILREVQRKFPADYGIRSRITSLKPLNPDNAADPWQARVLDRFASGKHEDFAEVSRIEGKPYLRMMRPFIVDSGCIKCHEKQGYRVGDIRGGIDCSVPMEEILAGLRGTTLKITRTHGMIWLAGAVVLTVFYRRERHLDDMAQHEAAFSDAVINSMPGAFYAYEDGQRLVRWNRNLELISGYSADELLNRHPLDWFEEKNRQSAEAEFQKMTSGGDAGFEAEFVFKEKTIPCFLTGSWLAMGERKFLICVGLDLAEQKKLESQLRQSLKMESIGRLAGGVAHDFNNMLGVIIGHAELGLMRLKPTDPVFRDLTEIMKSAERSADLTRQLLAFARRQAIVPKVLDLNESVSAMTKMLHRLIGEDIAFEWCPFPDPCWTKIDPSQLDQVLANLCVNSRDAIKERGRITIETAHRTIDAGYCVTNAEATPGEYVLLIVSDDGLGMDKETQNHIFEPFYTTKEIGKGTGMGLATVYGAVKQNKGFINIYSEPGKGTSFSVYLPRYESEQRSYKAESVAEYPRGDETILLVEDEPAILNISSLMLEGLGYSVLKTGSPGEAIRLAREYTGRIHLLLTDVIMPEMNGRELSEIILSIHPEMKRLLMSGYTADVIAHHGVPEDLHFIQKPFSIPVIACKVREVLDEEISP